MIKTIIYNPNDTTSILYNRNETIQSIKWDNHYIWLTFIKYKTIFSDSASTFISLSRKIGGEYRIHIEQE